MPSVLRFPANQEKDPDDLPDDVEETFTPPPELLIEQPNPPSRGTAAIRRSSATIVPEASFDEPTKPSDHPGPDLNDEFPWFETTAASTPAPTEVDASVDQSADTAALPTPQTEELPAPPSTNLPLLLAASAVMILLAGTAVMLVFAMLQKPQPAPTPVPVASTMLAPAEALPAPTIAVPEPVEAEPAPVPGKHTKKKAPAIEDVAPPEVTVTTPAIEAPKEPEKPAPATPASDTDDKKKKGLFGKKKDR